MCVCVIFAELRISRLTIDDLHHIKRVYRVHTQKSYYFGHFRFGCCRSLLLFIFVFTFSSHINSHTQTWTNWKIIRYIGWSWSRPQLALKFILFYLNTDEVDNIPKQYKYVLEICFLTFNRFFVFVLLLFLLDTFISCSHWKFVLSTMRGSTSCV